MANVARDAFANGDDFIRLAGKEGFSARCPRETASTPGFLSLIIFVEYADGCTRLVRLFCHLQDSGERVGAGVIAAIADYDQHLSVLLAGHAPSLAP